jgi:hypothetical protein
MLETRLFHLLMRSDVKPDVFKYSGMVAEILGINLLDSRRIVRCARGIFAENLPEELAGKLAARLDSEGLDVMQVESRLIPVLPQARRIWAAELVEEELRYKLGLAPEFRRMPWNEVGFLSCGIIATPKYRDVTSGYGFKALPAICRIDDAEARQKITQRLADKQLKKDAGGQEDISHRNTLTDADLEALQREQTLGYLDFADGKLSWRYRIFRHDFRYDYLKERAAKTSLENFKLLVADAAQLAKGALKTDATRGLLSGEPLDKLVFDNAEEFDRYNTWTLAMSGPGMAGGPRGQG